MKPETAVEVVEEWLGEDGNPPGRLSWMKQGPECRGKDGRRCKLRHEIDVSVQFKLYKLFINDDDGEE